MTTTQSRHRDGKFQPGARPIPPAVIHAWGILADLQADTARLCRAPLALVQDPQDTAPMTEPESFRARRIIALVLHMCGVPQGTIGQMIDRDRASVANAVRNAEADPWERQAAEQLATKYAPESVAS